MSKLTHISEDGAARMVDVGGKAQTERVAIASGRISMSETALSEIRAGDAPKGDVLGTARIAVDGILRRAGLRGATQWAMLYGMGWQTGAGGR